MRYQIWYMKPAFFREGNSGRLPNPANLTATHVHLKDIETNGIHHAYHTMQGDVWSPMGEARDLIESKGLHHTSMSIGDVIIDGVGNVHVVSRNGFKGLGGFKQ